MNTKLLGLVLRGDRVPVAQLVGAAALAALAVLLLVGAVVLALIALYAALHGPLTTPWAALGTAGGALALAGLCLVMARRIENRTTMPGAAELGADMVRQYPIESAAAALVAGFAVGGSPETRRALTSALTGRS